MANFQTSSAIGYIFYAEKVIIAHIICFVADTIGLIRAMTGKKKTKKIPPSKQKPAKAKKKASKKKVKKKWCQNS